MIIDVAPNVETFAKIDEFIKAGFEKCGDGGIYETTIEAMLIEVGLFYRTQKQFTQRRFKNKQLKSKLK